MSEHRLEVDAMLAVAASRARRCADALEKMRVGIRTNDAAMVRQAGNEMTEHIPIFNHALDEIVRLARIHTAEGKETSSDGRAILSLP
jgi:hypothetical protein